jgi:hypothetical protein
MVNIDGGFTYRSVAGGRNPLIKTHRTHTNLFIVTNTLTLGNDIPVDFVGKTRAAEEATTMRRKRRRTRKRRERM